MAVDFKIKPKLWIGEGTTLEVGLVEINTINN